MNLLVILHSALPSVAGFVTPYLLALTAAILTNLIEPGARFSPFLMASLHHPLRIEIASCGLHLLAGVIMGMALSLFARACLRDAAVVWAYFLAGFAFSILVITLGHGIASPGWSLGWNIFLFFVAIALGTRLARGRPTAQS